MSEKHLPYIGGNFDRIVFKGDGSTWVREQSGTRYSELFGTPERAARTMAAANDVCKTTQQCYPKCPLSAAPWCLGKRGSGDYDALLEWLGGDAE